MEKIPKAFNPPPPFRGARSPQKNKPDIDASIADRSAQINSGITEKIYLLDPEQIEPNPYQPRKHFDETALDELAKDIARDGQIQPVVVIDTGSRYVLVVGERRLRACKHNKMKIKATIENGSEETLKTDSTRLRRIAMMENIKREDLTTIERAESLQSLYEAPEYSKMTKKEFAAEISMSYTTVNRLFDILNLSPYIKEQIRAQATVSIQTLENLSRLDHEAANKLYDHIVAEGLNNEVSLDLIRNSKSDKRAPGHNEVSPSPTPALKKYNWGSYKSTNKKVTIDIAVENKEMIKEIDEIIKKYSKQ